MRSTSTTSIPLIITSFIVAIILTIVPLPDSLIWLRPQWIFAVLVFWVIYAPGQCGIFTAWCAGIAMDLLTGTPLCEHAIIFVLITYIILKMHSAIAHFPLMQQASFIAVFAGLNALLQGLILGFAGHSTHIFLSQLSAITTGLVWPWLYTLLDRFRPRALLH